MFSKINVLVENVPEAWQYLIGMYTSGDIIILYAGQLRVLTETVK